MIENYKYRYRSRGKIIFVPNERCERRGKRMLKFFSKRVDFPDYFYHYKSGGHVRLYMPTSTTAYSSRSTYRTFTTPSLECVSPELCEHGVTRGLAHFQSGLVSRTR
jgi:hypothetical protein